ncbi:hypothetical protein PLICRDRAFT_54898 [Plicaturopsis crispa FD-325 SS-3]|nr:hypothetical protein PLICRDRAFT_54898 [Plicaturopsis crispa FD-325 SS-3]
MLSQFVWVSLSSISCIGLKLALDKFLAVRRAQKAVASYPGAGVLLWLDPFYSIALMLAAIYPRPGSIGHYSGKFSLYDKYGSTCLTSIKVSSGQRYFWLADAEALKAVTSDRSTFQKDIEAYAAINIYGENLVGTEGVHWKRHRAVAKPAFNEANNALVWSETIRVLGGWFEELDEVRESTVAIDATQVMTQVTLLVISAAGFGRRTSWKDDSLSDPPPGHVLTFRSAVANAVGNVILKALTPAWLSGAHIPFLSKRARWAELAFDELRLHMLDLVSTARAAFMEGKTSVTEAALLTNLVEANMSEDSDYKRLTDDELLSNIFTFLLAGHETSAHTLSFAIALLALNPAVQQKLYEETSRVWPAGPPDSTSSYKDELPKLEYTTAVFRETLRLYPSEPRLVKPVHADTTLTARKFTPYRPGESQSANTFVVPVPKGSAVVLDIWALHMNPMYWGHDVDSFRPERFLDTETYRWPRDAFLPFSAGARACIGQRFAITESVCILANLVRRFEIMLPSALEDMPRREQERIMLSWRTGVTITPTNSHVRLRRRM